MRQIIKPLLLIAMFCGSNHITAQSQENLFSEAFDGMFEVNVADYISEGTQENPPPPVPVDGGLVALLAVGGAVGYKRFKAARSQT